MRQAPSEESHQHHRGHSHVNATSPNHPRRACAWHRHHNDGPPAPTIHAGHSLGHSPRDSRLHGQIHPLPRLPGHHHRRSQRGRYRPLLRQSPRYRRLQLPVPTIRTPKPRWTFPPAGRASRAWDTSLTSSPPPRLTSPRARAMSPTCPSLPASTLLSSARTTTSTHCSTTTGSTDTSSPSPPVTSRTSVRCGTGTPTRRRKRSPITSRREERKHGFTRLLDGIRG